MTGDTKMEKKAGRKPKMAKQTGKPDNTKQENGSQPVKKNHYTTVKMAPCKICERESSGYHFGVVTCEACKAFFRRAISKSSKISDACRQGNYLCAENPAKITGCPACRLQRCRDLGMSKGGARKGRYSLQLRTQSILDAKLEQEKREQAKRLAEAKEEPSRINENPIVPETINNHVQNHPTENLNSDFHNDHLPVHNDHPGFQDTYVPNGETCNGYLGHDFGNDSPNESISPSEFRRNWVYRDNCSYMEDFHEFSLEPLDFSLKPNGHFTSSYDSPTSVPSENSNFENSHFDEPSTFDSSNFENSTSEFITLCTKEPTPLIPEEEKPNYENLINELVKLQERLFPHQRDTKDITDRLKEIEDEHRQREEAYKFMFGVSKTEYVSAKEFNEVLSEVNIELDDRLKVLREKAKDNEKNIVQYIQHSRYIPGFHTLDLDDMLQLLKESYYEFWLISNYRFFDVKRGVSGGSEAVVNAHKKVLSSLFPKEFVEATFQYTETLKKLDLSLEEVAIVRVIVLTFTDRCQLKHPTRVEKLQNLFIKCLIYYMSKYNNNYRSRLCKILERLVEIRNLTHTNFYVNKQFVADWGFMLKDFPLWREMISRHDDGEDQ